MICPHCEREYTKFNIKQHIRTHTDAKYAAKDKKRRQQNGKKSINQLIEFNQQFDTYETRYGSERAKTIKDKISKTAKISQNNIDVETLIQKKLKLSTHAKANNYGGYKPGSGRGKKGWYNGIFCDSSWELAFVIYCLDNNIPIRRNQERFEYSWDGKIRKYIPDFIVDEELIEIKGFWSDQFNAKLKQCDKFIFVIDSTNINHYLQYARSVHGQHFVSLYEHGE